MELYKEKRWLYQQYWTEKKSMQQIAKEINCNICTIERWMKKHKIRTRTDLERRRDYYNRINAKELYNNKDWLYRMYWIERKTLKEMGDECACNDNIIQYWMKKFNIKTRNNSESKLEQYGRMPKKPYMNKNWLYSEYVNKQKSFAKIAAIYNVTAATIRYFVIKFGFEIRNKGKFRRNGGEVYTDKKWLYEQYAIKKKSERKIARECGCSSGTIYHWIKLFNIKMRNKSEALGGIPKSKEQREKQSKSLKQLYASGKLKGRSGRKNPMWNGGFFPYYGYNWDESRKNALIKSNNRSEISFNNGNVLAIHHIFPMRIFIHKYLDLCLKPYIRDITNESFRVLSYTLIPHLIFDEANCLDNLIVLTDSEHMKFEGMPIGFFDAIRNGKYG